MENLRFTFDSHIYEKNLKLAITFDLRGVLNFRRLYYTQDSMAITFNNGAEITMVSMHDLDEWYFDQLILPRRIYM